MTYLALILFCAASFWAFVALVLWCQKQYYRWQYHRMRAVATTDFLRAEGLAMDLEAAKAVGKAAIGAVHAEEWPEELS